MSAAIAGPWSLTITGVRCYVRGPLVKRGVRRAYVTQFDLRTISKAARAERIATARLITAAPAMRSALESILKELEPMGDLYRYRDAPYFHAAMAVIAKVYP